MKAGAAVAEKSGFVGDGFLVRKKTSVFGKKYRIASAIKDGVRRRRRRRKTRWMSVFEGYRNPAA